MKLLYDRSDLPHAKKLRDLRFQWLREIGASELREVGPVEPGFLFGYQQGIEHLQRQVEGRPNVRDRPEDREELVRLDHVLQRLCEYGSDVPTPRTWVLQVDEEFPRDLEFPLFIRTPATSWKRGGQQAKAESLRELNDEVELLRRAFGWDMPILARQWLDLATAGQWMFGDAPQEIRVWIVDGIPTAWSFHYLHAVRNPIGFPPSTKTLTQLTEWSATVAAPFHSRLIAADFAKDCHDNWHFLEAGPGAAAGTLHEAVFKFVAERIRGGESRLLVDPVGGSL